MLRLLTDKFNANVAEFGATSSDTTGQEMYKVRCRLLSKQVQEARIAPPTDNSEEILCQQMMEQYAMNVLNEDPKTDYGVLIAASLIETCK